jgi:hypothetical protein
MKQMMQIIYKDDIVQDYEFSDTTEHSSGGMLNQHGTEVATPSSTTSTKN